MRRPVGTLTSATRSAIDAGLYIRCGRMCGYSIRSKPVRDAFPATVASAPIS
jgi:hypothetical protein